MTDHRPDHSELTVGQLAARSGVTVSALHFYERQGLISSPAHHRQPAVLPPRHAASGGPDPHRPTSACRWRRSRRCWH